MVCDKCENLRALPPFPVCEEIFTTESGDLGIMVGPAIIGDEVDDVTGSITEYERVGLSDSVLVIANRKCNL